MPRREEKARIDEDRGVAKEKPNMADVDLAEKVSDEILELWRELGHEDQERLMIELLCSTDVGRKLAGGGLPFIPHYMWERSRSRESRK